MPILKNDAYFMKHALRLAKRGLGKTSPNPMVGAVIVKDEEIVSQGYHRFYGGPHAEIEAIKGLHASSKDSTMYITLEPCCHYGKTPPCTEAIMKLQFARIVVGTVDPNPKVNGKSIAMLKNHGFLVTEGVLRDECQRINEAYFKYVQTGIPFVTVKFAQTLDGRIATQTGHSQWISSEETLTLAHKMRSIHDATMVGVGTVIRDDPQLTVRRTKGKNPLRVILDSRLRIPPSSHVLNDSYARNTLIATTSAADKERVRELKNKGVRVVLVGQDEYGRVSLPQLLKKLGRTGISSLMVEGGGQIITSFLSERLVDKLVITIAPKIIGQGINWVGDLGLERMDQVLKFSEYKFRKVGDDIVFEGRLMVG